MSIHALISGFSGGLAAANGRISLTQALYDAVIADREGEATDAQRALVGDAVVAGDYVAIDLVSATGDGEDLLDYLEDLGAQNVTTFRGYASALVPIDALPGLDAAAQVLSATPVLVEFAVGAVENEAVQGLDVDELRENFDVDGTGVTIGFLSDTFDALGGYATDIATGDLPDDVLVLADLDMGSDEGRAMAQLIHDIAPGADLAFHTAFGGIADFANGILELAGAGAQVIVDDVRFFAEPVFSDGVIAQAIDIATTPGVFFDEGAVYFSSAGNSGRLGYFSEFEDSGQFFAGTGLFDGLSTSGFLHDFDPDPNNVETTQIITIGEGGGGFTLTLQWDDPFFADTFGQAAPDTDVDIVITIENGAAFGLPDGAPIFVSNADSLVNGSPVEITGISLGDGAPAAEIGIQIVHSGGVAPGFLSYTLFNDDNVDITTFDTQSSTIYGHAAAEGAIAVAASFVGINSDEDFEDFFGVSPGGFGIETPAINEFSSGGPTVILFDENGNRLAEPDVRLTPQITATDGVSTTVPGFGQFFGTSAAAPNAAAIAALALEAFPDIGRQEILAAFQETAIDITVRNGFFFGADDVALPEGFDVDSGAGLIQADAAFGLLSEIDAFTNSGGVFSAGTSGADDINGSRSAEFIVAGAGDDEVSGGGGDDVVLGGGGDDRLDGGGGDDWLFGGAGDDVLDGGRGVNTLTGGEGADTFRFDNRDAGTQIITDFEAGVDVAAFRIDGGFFSDSSISTINANQARVSSEDDVIELAIAALNDDGALNAVSVDGEDLSITIDADNHFRGDLTLVFEGFGGLLDGFTLGSSGDDVFSSGGRGPKDIITGHGADVVQIDNRDAGVTTIHDFEVGVDTLTFRIDGGYFTDSAIRTINDNQAAASTEADIAALIEAVLTDNGENNAVLVDGDDLILIIDADDHFRGDFTLVLAGVAADLGFDEETDFAGAGVVADASADILV